MESNIELADMLESYPSPMTPGFQTIITAKKEFSNLASDSNERLPPGRGHYFKHQKYTRSLLRAVDNLIILSETGTGKSCEFLSFAEYTRKELEKAKIDPRKADEKAAHFTKVIILVKGPTQKNEIKNQLVCRCSDGHYETDLVKKSKTEAVQKSNITAEIKRAGYRITTYTSFANRIAKDYPNEEDDERLANDYSDTIFWLDEAHNLVIDQDTGVLREKQQTYYTIWRLFHLIKRSKRVISTATPMINNVSELGSLINLILPLDGEIPQGYDYRTAPPNDIRVLFPDLPFDHRTATPDQIAPYFRGQFPPNYNFDTATLADLEPFLRGKLSFIRAADTEAVPRDQGVPQNDEYEVNGVKYQSQLVIYATAMSEHQSDGYMLAKQSVRGRDELFGAERQAANFVFPDGYWGNGITDEEREERRALRRNKIKNKEAIQGRRGRTEAPKKVEALPIGGILPITAEVDFTGEEEQEAGGPTPFEKRAFRRYVNKKGDNYVATAEFLPWLQDLAYIRMLSCKFSEIIRLCMEEEGNAFVYSEYVEGSGAIVLGLCFEGMGFVRYNETTSMFTGVAGDTVSPYCASSERGANNRRVRPDILSRSQGAPMRYALLDRSTSDSKFHSMMEAMNSYENRHGEYIKVLIASRVGRDAINVNNVLQIHLVASEWNQSTMYQALSRGIRAKSHDDLIKEAKEKVIAEGGDPSTVQIEIKVYKHAAVALDEANSSIDLQMYRMSEYKDRSIRRVMRMLKQIAIGCQSHYNRNVRDTDVDFSPACDYDVCKYSCVDPAPIEEDYSTYDVLYAQEVINDAIDEIINTFRQRNALTIEDISVLLPNYRRKYLIMALEQLITNKVPLIDRFGYTSYLREDNGSFYLDRSYPTGTPASYDMAYYTEGIIAIEQQSLANIVVKLETGEHNELLDKLERIGPTDPKFDALLSSISIEGQVVILEDVLLRVVQGERNDFTDAIVTKFQRMIFPINEPVTELNKIYEQEANKLPRRGRKKNPETKRRVRKINPMTAGEAEITPDTDTEIVYLHTLYSQVINQTAYATTARFNKGEGRTRILKPSEIEAGWRDINEIELPIYNAFIQIEIAKRNKPMEDQGVYGFILPDGKFRIRDKTTENVGARLDARQIKRGRVCEYWYRTDLVDVLWEIEADAPTGEFPFFKEGDQPQLINNLIQRKINKTRQELETWDLDRLIYYYKWYSAVRVGKDAPNVKSYHGNKIRRKEICDVIRARMEETGRLLK